MRTSSRDSSTKAARAALRRMKHARDGVATRESVSYISRAHAGQTEELIEEKFKHIMTSLTAASQPARHNPRSSERSKQQQASQTGRQVRNFWGGSSSHGKSN